MMTLQEIINSINSLPTEDRERLFEFIHQQEIESGRVEILANAQEVTQAFKDETAKKSSVDDLNADLLEEQQTNSQGFWDGLQEFRQTIEREGIVFTDEDFADLRDRSVGREIDL
jgi:cysteinyl-tRNA synthetase